MKALPPTTPVEVQLAEIERLRAQDEINAAWRNRWMDLLQLYSKLVVVAGVAWLLISHEAYWTAAMATVGAFDTNIYRMFKAGAKFIALLDASLDKPAD